MLKTRHERWCFDSSTLPIERICFKRAIHRTQSQYHVAEIISGFKIEEQIDTKSIRWRRRLKLLWNLFALLIGMRAIQYIKAKALHVIPFQSLCHIFYVRPVCRRSKAKPQKKSRRFMYINESLANINYILYVQLTNIR